MISDQELLYGAAFTRLVHYGGQISLTHLSDVHPAIYLVETNTSKSVILFKLSKKPKSSWSFTLSNQEQLAIATLSEKYSHAKIFFSLICHKDGICCILKDRLYALMDLGEDINGQHISVSRKIHGSYHVSGSGRQQMNRSIPQNDWPYIILQNRDNSHESIPY
jgi:hypothetical protein